jgi:hypothetical protein
MKKIISALSIFTIVVSALAFSPRYASNFCTAKPNSNGSCPNACTTKLLGYTISVGTASHCHETVPPSGSCAGVVCSGVKDLLTQEPPIR